jgi:hypothetical protein
MCFRHFVATKYRYASDTQMHGSTGRSLSDGPNFRDEPFFLRTPNSQKLRVLSEFCGENVAPSAHILAPNRMS